MARLVQANLMISQQGLGEYRIYATVHFQVADQVFAYDFDFIRDLRTGDPKINGQVEELCLKFAEEIAMEEKHGPALSTRRVVYDE